MDIAVDNSTLPMTIKEKLFAWITALSQFACI